MPILNLVAVRGEGVTSWSTPSTRTSARTHRNDGVPAPAVRSCLWRTPCFARTLRSTDLADAVADGSSDPYAAAEQLILGIGPGAVSRRPVS